MIPSDNARVDMHCHSTASEEAKLGIARSVGLPECATPPEEVYELAKRRGMDFVTITDHDTIAGCLEIADRADVFISEELTSWFKGEAQAVHILCYGITSEDHEFLQSNALDLEVCAAYLHEQRITCALAHPFFNVGLPLAPHHRRRLAELFPIWEVRNGSRARELNMPAAVYSETHGGTGIGGSDDHAGVDIGRTWTETPPASSPEEFLSHLDAGRAESGGSEGSAAKWAHAALALATRALMRDQAPIPSKPVDPAALLEVAERVVADGAARGGSGASKLDAEDVSGLLRAWLGSVGLPSEPKSLIALLQDESFSHGDLFRKAKRSHEAKLREAVSAVSAAAQAGEGYSEAARAIVEALIPAIPYVPSAALLGAEKAKLSRRDDETPRVAIIVDAIGSMHGVSHTVERIRENGVPGYDVEVIGTDSRVDRRLPAVAEVEMPFYTGMQIGIPSVPELVETLAEGSYDLVHVTAPGPAGIAATLAARIAGMPLLASHHTDFASYAGARSSDPRVALGARAALSLFFRQPGFVLSPSAAADRSLAELGVEPARIGRWTRGVDFDLYTSADRNPDAYPGELKVLYAGRLTKEKGLDLLADAFLLARERDPRLHLLLAGGGPEEGALRERLGDSATFLGWLGREDLARAYASSDLFLFCSQTDTYGQVIGEAQASGLPVVAVDAGGPAALIRHGRSGWLVDAEAGPVAAAVAQLAASPFLREQLAASGVAEARKRSWRRALLELAAGYDHVLAGGALASTLGEHAGAEAASALVA